MIVAQIRKIYYNCQEEDHSVKYADNCNRVVEYISKNPLRAIVEKNALSAEKTLSIQISKFLDNHLRNVNLKDFSFRYNYSETDENNEIQIALPYESVICSITI